MAIVSILLPVYNAESTISETIQSIINQTYKDWELYIINDGSVDKTEEIILSFKDDRIKYLKNNKNRGLIYTLNRGLSIAQCKYIARMDADDICMSTRLEKQVAYLDSHPEVIICGAQIEYFGTKSNKYVKLSFPTKDKILKEMLAFSTCFAHPTVMMRKDIIVKNKLQYDYDYKNAEDYCMWINMISLGKFANLDEALVKYRISDAQVSQPYNLQTIKSVMACRRKYLERYLSEDEIKDLFESPIKVWTVKSIKQKISNPRVIEACYLSLERYSLGSLLYYVFSADVFKLGFGAFVRYMKRFVFGKNPIYYNSMNSMKNHILLLLYIVLLFFLHFGFQINGINTRYLATILLLISCICVSSALIRLPMLKNSVFQKLLNSTIIYNIIVWLIPICLMTMDFSMLSGTIRFFICMVDIFLLWALLPRQYREYQLEFIVYIYLIQSVVILAAFVSPSLLEIVRQFQFESVTEITDRYLNYGTFRGLALAGDQFYGLTTSFGLISIFVMKFYVESSNIKWIGVFFVFFAANMFVGRTGFIGFFAALGYLFLSSKKNKFKSLFKIFVFTILLISILYLALPSSLKEVIDESVFAYAFQIFYNYKDSGSFSTSSSDRVAEMWQISIGFFTYLLGDGRFSNPDGTYYGKIDVGYLRQILYGGIAFLIYSVVLTWRMLTNYSKRYKIRQHLFEYIVLAYLLVIHAKGLSFMYCPEHMMIILFYYLHLNREKLAVFR